MDSNTHSTEQPTSPAAGQAGRLTALAAAVDELAVQDLDGLPDAVLAEEVIWLRWLLDRLEGRWLRGLAAVDGRGAAGADQGEPAASTASWLRRRLRLGPVPLMAVCGLRGRCSAAPSPRPLRP
jgi:hypothetical protein